MFVRVNPIGSGKTKRIHVPDSAHLIKDGRIELTRYDVCYIAKMIIIIFPGIEIIKSVCYLCST